MNVPSPSGRYSTRESGFGGVFTLSVKKHDDVWQGLGCTLHTGSTLPRLAVRERVISEGTVQLPGKFLNSMTWGGANRTILDHVNFAHGLGNKT